MARDVTFAALAHSLNALSRRQTLIAQNLANVNTPGYKRRDIDFSAELAAALEPLAGDAAQAGSVPERQQRVERILSSVAREVVEENFFYRADLGGVDLDREMAEQAKTSMTYAALAQLAQKKIQQYRSVIREGRV